MNNSQISNVPDISGIVCQLDNIAWAFRELAEYLTDDVNNGKAHLIRLCCEHLDECIDELDDEVGPRLEQLRCSSRKFRPVTA